MSLFFPYTIELQSHAILQLVYSYTASEGNWIERTKTNKTGIMSNGIWFQIYLYVYDRKSCYLCKFVYNKIHATQHQMESCQNKLIEFNRSWWVSSLSATTKYRYNLYRDEQIFDHTHFYYSDCTVQNEKSFSCEFELQAKLDGF